MRQLFFSEDNMKYFAPGYYRKFHCIADKCQDNCCIGWEIDIDGDTMGKYSNMGGEIGRKLKENITVSEDGCYCFRLTADERCPFLNSSNLCELILSGGDDMLCEICRLHPRFRNWLPDRCEIGLGLCCEAAAEIILCDKEPFSMAECENDDEEIYEYEPAAGFIMSERNTLISLIESSIPTEDKTGRLLGYGKYIEERLYLRDYSHISDFDIWEKHSPDTNSEKNIDLIISLEPLNDKWKSICKKLEAVKTDNFGYSPSDELYYGNLLKYYIYRYYANAADDLDVFSPIALAVFSADAVTYIKKATGMSFIDSACLWSKEIDYSAENIDMICDYLNQSDN